MKSTESKETEKHVKEEDEDEIRNLFEGIMEGYADSVIPPLSDFPHPSLLLHGPAITCNINEIPGPSSSEINHRKRLASSSGFHEAGNLEKERNRRDKMAEMYSVLQSMVVPNLLPKVTREAIVNNTIEYIQGLEKEIARLEDLKTKKNSIMILPESMAAKPVISQFTNRRSSVEVCVYGGVTLFGIQLPARRGLVTNIFRAFEKNQAEVLAANMAVDERRRLTVTVTAMIGGKRVDEAAEKIKREILII